MAAERPMPPARRAVARLLHPARSSSFLQLSAPWRYAIPLVATLLVFLVQLWILPRPAIAPFVFFFAGIALASWLGGWGPGLLAVALSALVSNYAFVGGPPGWSTSGPELRATALFIVAGSLVAVFCAAFRDSMLRMQRTAESLRRQSDMLALSHDAILVWKLGGAIESWSSGAEEMYGYSAEEALGRQPHTLLQTRFPQPLHEIDQILRTQGGWDGELTHATKDGRTLTVSTRWQLAADGERVLQTDRDITRQEATKQALRMRESALARAQAATHLGSWRWDLQTNAVSWSAELFRIFGVDPESFAPSNEAAHAMIHPDDRALHSTSVLNALSGQSVGPFESRIIRPDGEQRVVLASGFDVELDEAGKPKTLFGTILDITERKRSEEALRESERLQRLLADAGELASHSAGVDELVKAIGERVARELGVSRCGFSTVDLEAGQVTVLGDFHGDLPSLEGVHPIARDMAHWQQQGLAGLPVAIEDLSKHPGTAALYDAAIAPLQVRANLSVPLHREGKWVATFWAAHPQARRWTAREIELMKLIAERVWTFVERKRAEDALARREAILAQAGKMAHLGAWDIEVLNQDDLNANRLSWSEEVYRVFGYEPGSVAVTNDLFFQCVHPEDRSRITQAISRAIESKQPYSVQHRIVRSDGSERIVQEYAEAVFDEHGALRRLIGTVQDITELKRAEQALRETDRRKDEFLAMLSHELRNPLAPIRNSLYILDRSPPGGDQARRALATIDRQANHLTRLVGDLLDVSRITRGKIELRRARLDLCEVVDRTIEDHRPLFAAQGIELHVDEPNTPVWLNADATRLSQALGNVLQNAAKFTPEGGRVFVHVRQEGQSALLAVRDTGVGISPDILDRLFEPFTQADRSLDRTSGGLGLGLALVKGLVVLHGGEVHAASEGLGRGAEITIRLPVEIEPPRPARPRLEAVRPRTRRVLVIEDNVDAAESLKEALELDDHLVAVAYTGPEGLAKARAFSPDIVLCDIGLPGMDGYDVARAFRADEALQDIALIALTGYAGPEDRRRAASAGFDHHLAKPPDMDKIERILAEAPDRHAA